MGGAVGVPYCAARNLDTANSVIRGRGTYMRGERWQESLMTRSTPAPVCRSPGRALRCRLGMPAADLFVPARAAPRDEPRCAAARPRAARREVRQPWGLRKK